MKVDFTARRAHLDPRVAEIIETKLGKLQKVLPRGAEARAVLRAEKKSVEIEITVSAGQRSWAAAESGATQETAAHAVLERIEAQVKKTKARVKEEKKHRTSGVRRPEVWTPPVDEAPEPPPAEVPRRERLTVRPLFEEDAVAAFTGGARDILVFRDPNDDTLRVLYRRRDGKLGLVVPV